MYRLSFILFLQLVANLTYAEFRAISPAALAEIEQNAINSLKFQNGCARPILSDSDNDGTAVFEIAFDRSGKPIDAKIISSNGSDSDNSTIIHSFLQKCKYTSKALTLPPGVSKQFTYSWKAHQDYRGIRGCVMKLEYPTVSKRLNEEGTVELSFRYLPGGLYESKISQSSGFQRLDETSQQLINACLENHAIPVDSNNDAWNPVRMIWRLNDGPSSSSTSSFSSQNSKD